MAKWQSPSDGQSLKLDYGQHINKYLKATQIAKEIIRDHGVTVTFIHHDILILKGPNVSVVRNAIDSKVDSLHTRTFSLPVHEFERLKSIKHAVVIGKFRDTEVWAGWSVNEPDEVKVCSSNPAKLDEACNILLELSEPQSNTTGWRPQCSEPSCQISEPSHQLSASDCQFSRPVRQIFESDCQFSEPDHQHKLYGRQGQLLLLVLSLLLFLAFIKCFIKCKKFFELRRKPKTDHQHQLSGRQHRLSEPNGKPKEFHDRLPLKMEQLRYFKLVRFGGLLEKEFGVCVFINSVTCCVDLSGDRLKVLGAVEKLYNFVKSKPVKKFQKSEVFLKCLQKIKNSDLIGALRVAQVAAGCDIRDASLWVCSGSERMIETAEMAVSNLITERYYPQSAELSRSQIKGLKQSWSELFDKLKSQSSNVELSFDESSSRIFLSLPKTEHMPAIIDVLENFFESFQLQEKQVHLPSQDTELLFQLNKIQLEEYCRQLEDEPVTFTIGTLCIKLSSNSKKSLDNVAKRLQSKINSVKAKSLHFEKRALVAWLNSPRGTTKLDDISSVSRTVYKISQKPFTMAASDSASKVNMNVIVGDIAHLLNQVDGIMTSSGAISQTVESLLGIRLDKDIQNLKSKAGKLLVVYHTQLLEWTGDESNQTLARKVRVALIVFERNGLKRVILPAIGTGNLRYPAAEVADTMINTTYNFLTKQNSTMQVDFVIYRKDEIYKAFNDGLKRKQPVCGPVSTTSCSRYVEFIGMTTADVQKAIETLKTDTNSILVKDQWINSPYRPAIQKLTPQQIAKLRSDGDQRNVDITVDLSQPNIIIEGLQEDVGGIRDQINTLLHSLMDSAQIVPSYWVQNGQIEVRLDEMKDYEEFNKVHAQFLQSSGGTGIVVKEIFRIENVVLYTQYQAQKVKVQKEVDRAGGNIPVERELWHGTDSVTASEICKNEFNRSFAGRNAIAYGKGSYFSTTSGYSIRYSFQDPNPIKTMILAQVATGRHIVGNSSMDRTNLPKEYHSTVNQIKPPPTIFVVYHDAAAYPAYVIKFSVG